MIKNINQPEINQFLKKFHCLIKIKKIFDKYSIETLKKFKNGKLGLDIDTVIDIYSILVYTEEENINKHFLNNLLYNKYKIIIDERYFLDSRISDDFEYSDEVNYFNGMINFEEELFSISNQLKIECEAYSIIDILNNSNNSEAFKFILDENIEDKEEIILREEEDIPHYLYCFYDIDNSDESNKYIDLINERFRLDDSYFFCRDNNLYLLLADFEFQFKTDLEILTLFFCLLYKCKKENRR